MRLVGVFEWRVLTRTRSTIRLVNIRSSASRETADQFFPDAEAVNR